MILDTSFILDLWGGDPSAVAKAQEINVRGEPLYIPTPALFELWDGVARSHRPGEETEKIRAFVASHHLLPFGEGDAREAGLLQGRLARTGRPMNTVDVMVAGMAKARQQAVLAADRRFRELSPDIQTEMP